MQMQQVSRMNTGIQIRVLIISVVYLLHLTAEHQNLPLRNPEEKAAQSGDDLPRHTESGKGGNIPNDIRLLRKVCQDTNDRLKGVTEKLVKLEEELSRVAEARDPSEEKSKHDEDEDEDEDEMLNFMSGFGSKEADSQERIIAPLDDDDDDDDDEDEDEMLNFMFGFGSKETDNQERVIASLDDDDDDDDDDVDDDILEDMEFMFGEGLAETDIQDGDGLSYESTTTNNNDPLVDKLVVSVRSLEQIVERLIELGKKLANTSSIGVNDQEVAEPEMDMASMMFMLFKDKLEPPEDTDKITVNMERSDRTDNQESPQNVSKGDTDQSHTEF